MKKLLWILLVVVIFMVTTAQTTVTEDGTLILGEPVPYPTNFDELYCLVEGCDDIPAHPAWRFEPCEIEGPRLHWDSAVRLFTGTPDELEEMGFFVTTALFFEGWWDVCGDEEGKPILFGQGVNEFFKWYGDPNYVPQAVPDFLEGLASILGE